MLQVFQPAKMGRAFFPFHTDSNSFAAEAAPFQVPMNLSADEIRDLVRDLLG